MISVILPCYNVAKYLSRCLLSFKDDNFEDYEIIVVDDGSCDNIKEIVCSLQSQIRIKYFYQENQGVSAARNMGLLHAEGNYVYFCDPDDIVESGMLAELNRVSSVEKFDCFIFGYKSINVNASGQQSVNFVIQRDEEEFIGRNNIITNLMSKFIGIGLDDLYKSSNMKNIYNNVEYCGVWRILYSRKFLVENNIKFKVGMKLGEDKLFICESLSRAERVKMLDAVYYNYYKRQDGAFYLNSVKKKEQLPATKTLWIRSYADLRRYCLEAEHLDILPYYAGSCIFVIKEIIKAMSSFPYEYGKEELAKYLTLPDVREAIQILSVARCPKFMIPFAFIVKFRLHNVLLYLLCLKNKYTHR